MTRAKRRSSVLGFTALVPILGCMAVERSRDGFVRGVAAYIESARRADGGGHVSVALERAVSPLPLPASGYVICAAAGHDERADVVDLVQNSGYSSENPKRTP